MTFEEKLRTGALRNANILVLGLGIDAGESAARYFANHGHRVIVYDQKEESAFAPEAIALLRATGVQFRFGAAEPDDGFDAVIRSPGIPLSAPLVRRYADAGVPISSATKVFFALCPGIAVGVTGTKGKGTCCSLLFAMLQAAGRNAVLGGNIGTPLLDLLPQMTPQTVAVLELSSFQLIDLGQSPHIAVVLMTTEDHLDVHADIEEYLAAKANLVNHQKPDDLTIYNPDYPNTRAIVANAGGTRYEVSAQHAVPDGCFADTRDILLARAGKTEPLATIADVRIPGRHNLENACAAALAAHLLGTPTTAIQEGLRRFTGLEHRLEFVGEMRKVKYYNDSFATNPSSAIAAVRAFDAPKVLILGGSPKGNDFTELAEAIRSQGDIRAIVGIGEEWPRIKAALDAAYAGAEPPPCIEGQTTMHTAVRAAADAAKPGDVVILSPACASFDMFKNYKERGTQFKDAVRAL